MLNSNALAELSKLKQIIEDNKDSGEGSVRGSQGRYGFVNLDDGRSVYLSAEEMQRVLPGDRVLVEVVTNDKKKQEAKLEKLLQKNFKIFVGTYTIKGNAHFVIPDHRETSRGLFVPPKERKKFAEGDFVQCQLSRHPFTDGKSQVKILNFIGKRDDIGVEHRFITYKHKLADTFAEVAEKQTQEIQQTSEKKLENVSDLGHLPFVTIDSASTEDLDDAVYAENQADNGGWTLYCAIADPSAHLASSSPLDKEAQSRASSVYFPGQVIPMFPPVLSTDTFSLAEQKMRLALVCKMQIAADGEITAWEFIDAQIKSQAKLTYEQVAEFIDQGSKDAFADEICQNLEALKNSTGARKRYRQDNNLVQDDNIDYHYKLNDKMLIESISIRQSSSAHSIVEEAMLATNCCAGEELASKAVEGALYSTHLGFRTERLQEIRHLLKLEKPDYDISDIDTFNGFKRLMKALSNNSSDHQLLWTLRRLLQGASISVQPDPHYGLGFKHYALITSPIRRYQDLHNHRLLKQSISKQQGNPSVAEDQKIQEKITAIRTAQRELNQRLLCHFLDNSIGQEFDAKIAAISSQGLALRLIENGAESFLPLRKGPNQSVKYDSVRLTLTVNDTLYQIEQTIKVKLEKVDKAKYQLVLTLADAT